MNNWKIGDVINFTIYPGKKLIPTEVAGKIAGFYTEHGIKWFICRPMNPAHWEYYERKAEEIRKF